MDLSITSAPNEGLGVLLNGVEVKQVFGLECGRSALTGVGFILLDGLAPLKKNNTVMTNMNGMLHIQSGLTRVRWVMTQQVESPPSC